MREASSEHPATPLSFVEIGTRLARHSSVDPSSTWEDERRSLLGRRISELGLSIRGSRVERLVRQLESELAAKGLAFTPVVYLSDQWGCPDGTPLIGVPFYLVDARLERIEEEMSGGVEDDAESMRYLRHECGHAINYAFALYERPEWRQTFGPFSRPYRDRYGADPFSRAYVRHILGWYAQKHPDEDFAETFAVWLTPGIDWRSEYAGWSALAKLEYVDRVMSELAGEGRPFPALAPGPDDLPVDSMTYTVAEHYESERESIAIEDPRQFDIDLHRIFLSADDAPAAEPARAFMLRQYRECVARISYWTAESPSIVRSLLDHLGARAEALDLRVGRVEAATLIELTAFVTAVIMGYRYARVLRRTSRSRPGSGGGGSEEAA